MARFKTLFDVNVILDVLLYREPYIRKSGPLLELVTKKPIDGFVSASSIDTLAFILKKHVTSKQVHTILKDLLIILNVIAVNAPVINRAIELQWSDLEDAILFETACEGNCNFLATRNLRDFKKSDSRVEVLNPEALLKQLS